MPGPRPKPTKLKALAGNPGKRRLNDAEPQPPAGDVRCPKWLSPLAKKEWKRIVPILQQLGLITQADTAAAAAYCQALAELQMATETLDRDGRIIYTPEGKAQKHPACSLQSDASAKVRSYLAEFGLSPATRSRISTSERPTDGGEDIDLRLLG